MSLISDYKTLKTPSDTISEIPVNIVSGTTKANKLPEQQPILKYLPALCEEKSVSIKEISQSYSQGIDSLLIETNKIVLQGGYSNILALIYSMETEKKVAAVSSVSWQLTKDKTSGTYSLLAILYIKRIVYDKEK